MCHINSFELFYKFCRSQFDIFFWCRNTGALFAQCPSPVAYPGILFMGGSTNSVEDRENGDLGGGSPLVRDSGGSCNLVQEISFHMVTFSSFLVLYL